MLFIINKLNRNKDLTEEQIRTKYGVFASVYSIILNIVLFSFKMIIGVFSNSISIIADAVNNLTDVGGSIISFFGFKLSSMPADEEHPYGHQRIEYITSFVISIIILVIGIELLINSFFKIFSNDIVVYSYLTIMILTFSIFIKLYLAFFNNKIAKKINSTTLKASARDSINDAISTFVILISALVMMFFDINIDAYMGMLVSIFILYSGISLIKETISPLIGEKTDINLVNKIVNYIKGFDEILGVHDVMSHSYGPTKIFMSLHVEIDAKSNIIAIHEVIDNIEFDVLKNFGVSLVIHMDPIELDSIVTNKYKNIVSNFLNEKYPVLSFHDFRVVEASTHINIIFDIVVPFDFEITNQCIEKELNTLLSSEEVKIKLILTFDKDFSTIK